MIIQIGLFASTFCLFVSTFFLFVGCARAPIKSVDEAMRPAETSVVLADDLQLANLLLALEQNIETLKKTLAATPVNTSSHMAPPMMTPAPQVMRFGPKEISKDNYIAALQMLMDALKADPSGELFIKKLMVNFDMFEVFGGDEWGKVFITSYFEPVIQGRLRRTKKFTQPIYGIPSDMVTVNMPEFAKAFPALEAMQKTVIEKSRDGFLRGRMSKNPETNLGSVIPYYSRQEIDENQVIKEKAAILAYVDPVDAFFLHIQGSGRIQLGGDIELKVGYAAQNGHPYFPIGKLLLDKIPKEKMSTQKIQNHLRSLKSTEAQLMMNKNPSYVFFKSLDTEPITYLGSEVVSGRTIATDQMYFPKGSLAFLQFDKPILGSAQSDEVVGVQPVSRFVLDQDTGGAIRGPARVDLFWGRGPEAEQMSGVMRQPGRLYYFVPNDNYFKSLPPGSMAN